MWWQDMLPWFVAANAIYTLGVPFVMLSRESMRMLASPGTIPPRSGNLTKAQLCVLVGHQRKMKRGRRRAR